MRKDRLTTLRELYEGDSDRAHRFRYVVLTFDIVTVLFVIATSFTHHGPVVEAIDAVFGVFILADFAARIAISQNRLRFLLMPVTLADIVSIISFLAPLAGEGLGFLRVVRTLRFLHTYQLLKRLRADFPFFRHNQDVFIAAINLMVFIFVMTGLVYATQYGSNPQISNYADALYFTVTALTTTGFGDITLTGSFGRMISVVVMIFGVTLFLRLAQVLFRPNKVRETCRTCGLSLHDADAVHCKHCGAVIHIETEGQN
ncbi:potassium channel family protein [Salipiger abyssi]|uniref:Voltage-gated potassium channel n=1 Tax=Salipiger abyssi TaxID=1250539 RepID=A0A1P8UTP7_9RHOB|nr:potassium channel family protein [Salipiger abyssi]APZ52770.1 voltage-gated potassium channel [Salipiger abyssi]